MKILLVTLSALLLQTAAYARSISNLPHSESQVEISRVVNVIKLVEKPGLQVSIVVEDLGGSTDVSPTQVVYFTLYSKGEMFSTDATFKLGHIYELQSAKRLSGGVYELKYSGPDDETSMPTDKKMIIDAQEAILDLKEVDCSDFDCEASRDFKATIKVKESNL